MTFLATFPFFVRDTVPPDGSTIKDSARFLSAILSRQHPPVRGNEREEFTLFYHAVHLAALIGARERLAKYYADRTVREVDRFLPEFFARAGLEVDIVSPSLTLREYMAFPHIYPETKIYHLPVRAGRVFLRRDLLKYVAGCLAYRTVLSYPVGDVPDVYKNYVSLVVSSRPVRESTYPHIERVLAASGLSDGRKRLLFYWIIPYLVTVRKMGDDEALETVKEWLSRQQGERILDSWIRAEIDNVRRKGIRPWGLNKVRTQDPGLYTMLEEVGVLR